MEIKPSRLDTFFIKAKKFADAVPIFSSLTNMINLLQKYFIVAHLSEETLKNHHYFKEIKEESYGNLALKVIPFYSTVLYVIDLKKRSATIDSLTKTFIEKPELLENLDNPKIFASLSNSDKKSICLSVAQKNGSALEFMPESFKNDRQIVQKAYKNDKNSFKHAGEKIVLYYVNKFKDPSSEYRETYKIQLMLRCMSPSIFEKLLFDRSYRGELLKMITPKDKLPTLNEEAIEKFESEGQLEKLFHVYFHQLQIPQYTFNNIDPKTIKLLSAKLFENPKKINQYLKSCPGILYQIFELLKKKKLTITHENLKLLLMVYKNKYDDHYNIQNHLRILIPSKKHLNIDTLKNDLSVENIKLLLFYRKHLSKEEQIELWYLVIDALSTNNKLYEAAFEHGIPEILSEMIFEPDFSELRSSLGNLVKLHLLDEDFIRFLAKKLFSGSQFISNYKKEFRESLVENTSKYLLQKPYRVTQLDAKTIRFNKIISVVAGRHLTEKEKLEIWKATVKEKPELYDLMPERYKNNPTIKDNQAFLQDELTRLTTTEHHLEYLEKTALLSKGQKTYLFSKVLEIDSKLIDKIPEEFRTEAQKMHEDRANLEILKEEVKKNHALLNYISPEKSIPEKMTNEEKDLIAKIRKLERFGKLQLCLSAVKSDPTALESIPEYFRITWHPEITTAARAAKSS